MATPEGPFPDRCQGSRGYLEGEPEGMLSRTTFSPLSALYTFSPTSPLSDLTQPLFTFKVVQHPPLQ